VIESHHAYVRSGDIMQLVMMGFDENASDMIRTNDVKTEVAACLNQ